MSHQQMQAPHARQTPEASRAASSQQARKATTPLVVQVIPPGSSLGHDGVPLSTGMQSLVLDRHHPLALEIAGTHTSRSFLLRASTPDALAHACTQLRARLPQAELRPVEAQQDPLIIRPGETVSAIELQCRVPYLPLRTWDPVALAREGTDPLLGLLAACDGLPEDLRVVSQLALVPAAPDWSRAYQRKALESALEPERASERWQMAASRGTAGAPSASLLFALALLLGLLVLLEHLPAWVSTALVDLAHGHWPVLATAQAVLFFSGFFGSIGLLLLLLLGFSWLRRRCGRTLYDSMLVRQKTTQPAYRVCLRLYVIGPDAEPRLPPLGRTGVLQAGFRLCSDLLRGQPPCLSLSPFRHGMWQALCDLRQVELRAWGQEHLRMVWLTCKQRIQASWQTHRTACTLRVLRQNHLARLVAAYRQYNLASGNAFVPRTISRRAARRLLSTRSGWRSWRCGWWRGVVHSSTVLSVEELALLWHLPQAAALADLAHLEHRRARTLPLPVSLTKRSANRPVIGLCEHAGHRLPVALPEEVLTRHLLVCGKSGEGKSTLLVHLAQEAMQHGGLVLVDPHGDLVDHVLGLVPMHRVDDVVLIDLSDTDYAVGLNPVDVTLGRGRDKAISDLLKTLSQIWVGSWGSRMEIAFAYALRTLYEANRRLLSLDPYSGPARQYTLLDVMPILTDESFCHSLLQYVDDPFITRWWHIYYDPLSLYMQRDRSDPVLSKIAHFESHLARRIVGQSRSTINLAECIGQERILLIKLAKGVVGEEVAGLLGATLLGLIQLALEEQGALQSTQRKRLPLIIDEFQVLSGVDWAALAELRKYGAAFTLATQSLEYLREQHQGQVLASVLASIKQYALFHLSARDAATLRQEVGVEAEDLINLESHMCYLHLSPGQVRLPTFSARLYLPPAPDTKQARHPRELCRQRYARPASQVEQELKEGIIRTLSANQPTSAQPPLVVEAASVSSSPGSPPPSAQASSPPAGGLVRQQSGYRGRKAQKQRIIATAGNGQGAGAIRPMNWSETVGQPPTHLAGGSDQPQQPTEPSGGEP